MLTVFERTCGSHLYLAFVGRDGGEGFRAARPARRRRHILLEIHGKSVDRLGDASSGADGLLNAHGAVRDGNIGGVSKIELRDTVLQLCSWRRWWSANISTSARCHTRATHATSTPSSMDSFWTLEVPFSSVATSRNGLKPTA